MLNIQCVALLVLLPRLSRGAGDGTDDWHRVKPLFATSFFSTMAPIAHVVSKARARGRCAPALHPVGQLSAVQFAVQGYLWDPDHPYYYGTWSMLAMILVNCAAAQARDPSTTVCAPEPDLRPPKPPAIGGIFLLTKWPESQRPGRFDFWLQSHQVWHSCHTLAGLIQYAGQRSATLRYAAMVAPCG